MLKNLFSEFFTLTYKPGVNHYSGVTDFPVNDRCEVVVRESDRGITFYYIYNGNSIYIPWEWIDLFSSFNTHSGSRALYVNNEFELDSVSKFIYLFLKLITYINTKNKSYLLPTLADICKIRSKDFNTWLKEEFGYTLPGIIYSTPDKIITI